MLTLLNWCIGSGLRVSWLAFAPPTLRASRSSYCQVCLHFRFIRSYTLICRDIRPDQRNPSLAPLQLNLINTARSTITLPPCVFCFCGSTKRDDTPPLIERNNRALRGGILIKHTTTFIFWGGELVVPVSTSVETLTTRLLRSLRPECLCAINGATRGVNTASKMYH